MDRAKIDALPNFEYDATMVPSRSMTNLLGLLAYAVAMAFVIISLVGPGGKSK